MSGFHTAKPGTAPLPIAFKLRTTAAPSKAQHSGSTTPEIAGQGNPQFGIAELFLDTADFRLAFAVMVFPPWVLGPVQRRLYVPMAG